MSLVINTLHDTYGVQTLWALYRGNHHHHVLDGSLKKVKLLNKSSRL